MSDEREYSETEFEEPDLPDEFMVGYDGFEEPSRAPTECVVERNAYYQRELERELRQDGTTDVAAANFRTSYARKIKKPFTGNCPCSGCQQWRAEHGIVQIAPAPGPTCTRCACRRNQRVELVDGVCPTCSWSKGQKVFG